jgi:hypothetical protein
MYRVFTVTPATHYSTKALVEHLSRVVDEGKKQLAVELLQVFDKDVEDLDVIASLGREAVRVTHRTRGVVDLASFGDGMRRSAAWRSRSRAPRKECSSSMRSRPASTTACCGPCSPGSSRQRQPLRCSSSRRRTASRPWTPSSAPSTAIAARTNAQPTGCSARTASARGPPLRLREALHECAKGGSTSDERFVYLSPRACTTSRSSCRCLHAARGEPRSTSSRGLDEPRRGWIGGFKWPHKCGRPRSIGSPCPRRSSCMCWPRHEVVALRNAEGITEICSRRSRRPRVLLQRRTLPEAIGVFLDSDKEPTGAALREAEDLARKISEAPGSRRSPTRLAVIAAAARGWACSRFPNPAPRARSKTCCSRSVTVPYPELCRRRAST